MSDAYTETVPLTPQTLASSATFAPRSTSDGAVHTASAGEVENARFDVLRPAITHQITPLGLGGLAVLLTADGADHRGPAQFGCLQRRVADRPGGAGRTSTVSPAMDPRSKRQRCAVRPCVLRLAPVEGDHRPHQITPGAQVFVQRTRDRRCHHHVRPLPPRLLDATQPRGGQHVRVAPD